MGDEGTAVHQSNTPVVDTRYGGESGQSPVMAVIDAVAEAANVDPTELPPLYESVDPDALDGLFDRDDGQGDATLSVSFTVGPWNVFVSADGAINVYEGTQPTDSKPAFTGDSA